MNDAWRRGVVDGMDPAEAFDALSAAPSAALVDVRTRAEWIFTGLPDVAGTGKPLWPIEWASFPAMAPNAGFVDQLDSAAKGTMPAHLFFICRSGARSRAAAETVLAEAQARGIEVRCTNVEEGFEGDLDAAGHRGTVNGWKVRGLPWRQS